MYLLQLLVRKLVPGSASFAPALDATGAWSWPRPLLGRNGLAVGVA